MRRAALQVYALEKPTAPPKYNLQTAQENYRVVQAKLDAGMATILDVPGGAAIC